jgi:hypothetical protein
MVTFSADVISNDKPVNIVNKSGTALAKPTTTMKKNRNILPRPGTYGAYPAHGSTTVVKYFGVKPEVDKSTPVNTRSQTVRPEQDTFTFRKVLLPGDTRWRSSSPQVNAFHATVGMKSKNYCKYGSYLPPILLLTKIF